MHLVPLIVRVVVDIGLVLVVWRLREVAGQVVEELAVCEPGECGGVLEVRLGGFVRAGMRDWDRRLRCSLRGVRVFLQRLVFDVSKSLR